MKKLYTNGCSMTWGSMPHSELFPIRDEWDALPILSKYNLYSDCVSSLAYNPESRTKKYSLLTGLDESIPKEWGEVNKRRKNHCWPTKLGKLLDVPVIDYSLGGGSCPRIVRTTYEYFAGVKNPEDYFAIIQLTGGTRIEFWEEETNLFRPLQIHHDGNLAMDLIKEFRKYYITWEWERQVYLQSAITLASFFKSLGIQYFITGFFDGRDLKNLDPGVHPQLHTKEWLDLCDFAEKNVNWYKNFYDFNFFDIPYQNCSGDIHPVHYKDGEGDQHPSERGHTEIAKIFKNYIESNFET